MRLTAEYIAERSVSARRRSTVIGSTTIVELMVLDALLEVDRFLLDVSRQRAPER